MTTYTIGLGETIVIPARTVEEHLHDLRRTRGLPAANDLENGAKAKILRAYTRPRDQSCISIEVSETEVKVIAMVLQHKDADGNALAKPLNITERGRAVVDIIDEISEPWGDDHEIYVVRKPQLKAKAPEAKDTKETAPAAPAAVKVTAPAPLEVNVTSGLQFINTAANPTGLIFSGNDYYTPGTFSITGGSLIKQPSRR